MKGGRKFIVIMGGLENSNPTLNQVQGFKESKKQKLILDQLIFILIHPFFQIFLIIQLHS